MKIRSYESVHVILVFNFTFFLSLFTASSKLRRMKSAIDAKIFVDILPVEYQDVHVVAGVLKAYLRDLPEPLLTYKLYENFIDAATKQTEQQRKNTILNTINQLPKENYFNLRYLMKFLTILSQNHKVNKMSTQNIAIVMSPNLLWQKNQDNIDYAEKVSSTAAVNAIVELLIADWNFFFDGNVEFYDQLTKERLFQDILLQQQQHQQQISGGGDNGSSNIQMSDLMSKSMISPPTTIIHSTVNNTTSTMTGTTATATSMTTSMDNNNIGQPQQQHSRSSSHDTSLILLTENIKRSQSSSSLSDNNSSPIHGSPKLPIRRKHNKSLAPTPPDLNHLKQQREREREREREQQQLQQSSSEKSGMIGIKLDEKFIDSNNHHHHSHHSHNIPMDHRMASSPPDRPPQPIKLSGSESVENLLQLNSMSMSSNSSNNSNNKPDKPPRPDVNNQTQTLNRHAYKIQKSGGGGYDSMTQKPKAMPRSAINIVKSTEQLTLDDSTESQEKQQPPPQSPPQSLVTMREKFFDDNNGSSSSKAYQPHSFEKPAIPERPASLIRPFNNYRINSGGNMDYGGSAHELNQTSSDGNGGGGGGVGGGGGASGAGGSIIKKTQSFRSNQLQNQHGKMISNSNANNNSNLNSSNSNNNNNNGGGGIGGGASGGSTNAIVGSGVTSGGNGEPTTLQRTHIYNVDKQQVSIIDVVGGVSGSGGNGGGGIVGGASSSSTATTTTATATGNGGGGGGGGLISLSNDDNDDHSIDVQLMSQVPPSPRGFNPKVKRPQVPAPAPPNRPKSSDTSTNL